MIIKLKTAKEAIQFVDNLDGKSEIELYRELQRRVNRRRIEARKVADCNLPRLCCLCGTKKTKIDVHHLDSNPHNNQSDNLVRLCSCCHRTVHGNNISLNWNKCFKSAWDFNNAKKRSA